MGTYSAREDPRAREPLSHRSLAVTSAAKGMVDRGELDRPTRARLVTVSQKTNSCDSR